MKKLVLFIALTAFATTAFVQEYVYRTFNDTRVISGHSVETLEKSRLDIRISHRFGDLLGDFGGMTTFYGLEDVADVRIAVEYGVTNNLSVGVGRSKGSGPYRQIVDGYVKYKILSQKTDGSMPFSLTALAITTAATSSASTDLTSPTSYQELAHRFAYASGIIIARKFNDRFSMQLSPTYVHRNYVAYDDQNGIFSAGAAARFKVTKVIGIIAEYHYLFPYNRTTSFGTYFNPIGLGVEFDTGGHVFQINYTNSKALLETGFIPYTSSDLLEGQFRLGFTISRTFKLKR
ncbi:MAG: hypothetical protein JKY54_18790 [Flavobacteriales bacterium]|nr:hypothetical protein [Flavobacteriales bacterium]